MLAAELSPGKEYKNASTKLCESEGVRSHPARGYGGFDFGVTGKAG